MSIEDADRWNNRYRQTEPFTRPPNAFVTANRHLLPRKGLALDLAMGTGKNANVLLNHGLQVVGVDISTIAALQAKKRFPRLNVVVADLTRFWLPKACFDVILNIRYTERSLWPATATAIKPGGLLLFEGLHIGMAGMTSISDPSHLLDDGELADGFKSLETLDYYEGWIRTNSGKEMAVSRLIARKKSS